MINNIVKIEVKIGERSYQMLCELNSPLGELHDALTQMKHLIINKMKELQSPPPQQES